MARSINSNAAELLSNKDWLYEQHVTNLCSIVEIAKLVEVTPAVVRKFIRQHGIISPTQQQLREASNNRKYGVPNPGMIEGVRIKALNTMTIKYGGHNWSTDGNREKRDATCKEKYGDPNVGKTEYARQKAKQTNMLRYGREHINQKHISDEAYTKINSIEWLWDQHNNLQRPLSDIARECGVDMSILMIRLRQHDLETQHFFHSTGEREVLHFLENLLPDTPILHNVRNVIPPYELDIYIPSWNLAIEYCGLYWHSTEFKERTYHQKKMQACSEQGIRLITLFEDEWTHRQNVVKTKLQHILNKNTNPSIPARKTKVVTLTSSEKSKFFEKNHIQGSGPGSITYGLQYNEAVIAAMTFIQQGDVYVLNRYATSCIVPGGFSKLLNHFTSTHEWSQVVSFADLRWSTGLLYEQTGWVLDKTLPVDYYWCKNGKRYHKFGFRHRHLSSKLSVYDPTKPENVNCKNNGYTKIYNCGINRYVITREMIK